MVLHRTLLAGKQPRSAPPVGQPELILAHGFTQNGRCWGSFGALLAAKARVTAVDAPGHGRSRHDDADLDESARLLVDAGGPGIYVGYSMGGRVALHAALARPEVVQGLVLIGATAGIDDETERAARRAADDELAAALLRDGVGAFLDRWLAGPLFATLGDEQSARSERLTNRAEGLAASLRRCGTGTQQPLWPRLGELEMPVLILVGDGDEKFSAIGRRLVSEMTGTEAELERLPGGHAVHLELPEAAAAAIIDRLDRWH